MESGPWLEFAPGSEQEVVILFGLLLPRLPDRYLINEVRMPFPDCIAWKVGNDGSRQEVRIEFELRASNFIMHKHDETKCDLIVCWEDDLGKFSVPRLELRSTIKSLKDHLIESPERVKYPPQSWTEEKFLNAAPLELQQLHLNFLHWATGLSPYFRVAYGDGNQFASWSLAVCLPTGKKETLLGVYADGTIWVQPQSVSNDVGLLYRSNLANCCDERDLGKQWFFKKLGIADPLFLATVKRALLSISDYLRSQ
jgi:hypothetical protein